MERMDERPNQSRYDYTPRASRFGSLEEETPRFEEQALQRPTRSGGARQRTVMFSLHTLEDCCDVIDNLIINNTVVLTMDDLDPKLMQRAVDTLSGAVFALHATIRKASERTYLIAPSGVEVNETYDMDRRF
jgi:FtsZ-interacting cell division protein YlmF